MKLITIEGIDGAGKSTLVSNLKNEFTEVKFTREPYIKEKMESNLSELINKKSELTNMLFYLLDHSIHLEEVIKPNIKNRHIICDRYIDSRIAYQSAIIDKISVNYLKEIHSWSIKPDLTILLDLPPQKSLSRINPEHKFEKQELLERVRENYLKIYNDEPDRFFKIDATKDPDSILSECTKRINKELN